MLRASSEHYAQPVALDALMGKDVASGIPDGAALIQFAEAVVARDSTLIALARNQLVDTVGAAATVDAAGVISNFQRMVRIADSTGIGLGRFETSTVDLRESLGIDSFRPSD